jgi:5,10-methylenetetrahydromethanopterin reductase
MTVPVTPPRTGVWFFPEQPAGLLVDAVGHAELAGLDEVWIGDEGPARDPFGILAAAALGTSRIALGVGVTNPYLRHPGALATTMLTVHELSGGRAILGVGAGGQISLAPFGVGAEHPLAAVGETLRLVRAVAARETVDGYDPPDIAVTAAHGGRDLPLFIGARGERLNRLASEVADGSFVAGLPPFRYAEVIGWSRSVRAIDVALYPSVAFTDDAVEHHRPELIWSLLDSPDELRDRHGLELGALQAAATALRGGDPGPARRLVTDEVVADVLLVGAPDEVGERLAELVAEHAPTSIGLALLQRDLDAGIDSAASAFEAMRRALAPAGAGGDSR